jgi:hypothetical protein
MALVFTPKPEAASDFTGVDSPFEQPFGAIARFGGFELAAEAAAA